jgi:aminoglycoside phosphotransferase (APT) family kinase protein
VQLVRSLTFGISSSLALVDVDGRLLVLRSYEREEEPGAGQKEVENEVRSFVAARDVLGSLVPDLVAADPSGAYAGCPSLLMTYLPGRPVIGEVDPAQLAEILVRLHSGPVPADLAAATPWFRVSRLAVPSWTGQPESWARLIPILKDPAPAASAVFLHRDFHHGNVLWADGRISGVVDWPSACTGPRGVDLAHTRSNLALTNGVEMADRLLAAYRAQVPRYRQDTWWDAAALVGHVQEDFAGLLAFNAFGARLDQGLLSARADRYAHALARAA